MFILASICMIAGFILCKDDLEGWRNFNRSGTGVTCLMFAMYFLGIMKGRRKDRG